MRIALLMALFCIAPLGYAQLIYSHEREISNKDSYVFSEIDFYNQNDDIKLSGTLIAPKSDFTKVVIILPGSGKDTRNSHYQLTQDFLGQGIAVYRFDERGVGKSQGKYTTSINGLTFDLAYAVQSLRSQEALKNKKIGVLGHSLGGMASVVANKIFNKEQYNIDFLIQVASPVKSFADASRYQIQTLPNYQVKNRSNKELVTLLDTLVYITQKNKFSNLSDDALRSKGIEAIKEKGFELKDIKFWSYTHIDLFKHDYEDAYKDLQIPTMYVIGSEDQYVSPTAEVNRLRELKNPHITIKVMKDLNHYLTRGELNANVLYNIDSAASKTIMNWIEKI